MIRERPEDFLVDEILPMEPDGSGEHCLLRIEKRGSNTDWVAGVLARHAAVPRRDVGYAGRKDRHAVTRQWFSVRLAGRPEPDWRALEGEGLRILQLARHGRKLRTGALRGNRFRLRVTHAVVDRELLQQRLLAIRERGIPNYFGEQRFGRDGGNLEQARRLFAGELHRPGRNRRGLYLSAARSLLFNRVLARRVLSGDWDRPLAGDWLALAGSRSGFLAEQVDGTLLRRCREMDLHPTGPLWGRGETMVGAEARRRESEVLAPCRSWTEGLERAGLTQERRPLRAVVGELEWALEEQALVLSFTLPKGSYATSLLREVIDYGVPG
ncbi:MAG TPA: tRNA pseudouridine(13) synthase TruD [Sedimenticola thiotaurini]|uniref:tRNA pseudouridine synthase D n=1 Tax=Sedimenticola thiotaurini TaxID=1543721 RepID=A0A831W4P6_9GAMM|nr:tRNA pseudouridine(13) synthase TruD [Sedimenticola thiotaurini]